MIRNILTISAAVMLSACGSTKINNQKATMDTSFDTIHTFAKMSSTVYDDNQTITASYDKLGRLHIEENPKEQTKAFVIVNDTEKKQVISVRGTANLKNAKQDAEYIKSKNKSLDIYLHKGFDKDARRIYRKIRPHLNKGHETHVTGHSLGGAMAVIISMYLKEEGFNVSKVITFGQPKVTNKDGAKKFSDLPLLRVVDEKDPVPLVPPVTLVAKIHGSYRHFGEELILLKGPYYSYLDQHDASRNSVSSFWKNLGNEKVKDHYMVNYLKRIDPKLTKDVQVPYDERKKYLK